jgi:hypothetical protein
MTQWAGSEPTLTEVQDEFADWRCTKGNSGLYYAEHTTTGQRTSPAVHDPEALPVTMTDKASGSWKYCW